MERSITISTADDATRRAPARTAHGRPASSVECRSVPDISQRDPEEVAAILTRWLATKSPGGSGLEVFDVQAPGSNGFSNETILCRTRSERHGERRLVVRVAPTKHLLFLDAQFSTQYRAMRALADGGSAVPLPHLGWYEEDLQYFGVPFFSMDHVDGLVPSDNIPYTMEGWVIEATPEQQERMWWSGIDALAAVHRTDWRATGLEWLSMADRGRPGLEQQLSYYRDFLDWATKGEHVPVIESTWQWLVDHRPPEDGDVVISWGDSRIGNIIWDDFSGRRRRRLGDGLAGPARARPGLVALLRPPVLRGPRRPAAGRVRLTRGHDRALLGAHGSTDARHLLLRDLLGLPLRRGDVPAVQAGLRQQPDGCRHGDRQHRDAAPGQDARPGTADARAASRKWGRRSAPPRHRPPPGAGRASACPGRPPPAWPRAIPRGSCATRRRSRSSR